MAEPRIRYAKTSDGVSIAYWTLGDSDPVVDMGTPPFSHILMEWQFAEIRSWYQRFVANHQYVRFDCRGTGLSERQIGAYSVDALVSDLEAVVDRLELEAFTLWGAVNAGLAAMTYAARHPERVSRLILWCAYAEGREFFDDPGTRALRIVLETDWSMFTETAAHSRFGWSQGEPAQRFAELIRAAVTPPVQALLMDALRWADVRHLLGNIASPTLVLQRESRGIDVARRIAAGIADARVVLLPGVSAAPYLDDADAVWKEVAEFLGDAEVPARGTPSRTSGLLTVLFTDLASSTALTQRLGDTQAQELLRAHDAIVREALAAHGGSEIKHTGDGIMASFPTASGALECAVAIQRAVAERNEVDLRVHVGINAGEPVAEDADLYGTAVQLARRICDEAAAGEILVSNVVRELAAGKGFLFADTGEVALKGFEDPARLYAVRWQDEG